MLLSAALVTLYYIGARRAARKRTERKKKGRPTLDAVLSAYIIRSDYAVGISVRISAHIVA